MLIEINKYDLLVRNKNSVGYGISKESIPRKILVNVSMIYAVDLFETYAVINFSDHTIYTDLEGYEKLKAFKLPTYIYSRSSVDIKY